MATQVARIESVLSFNDAAFTRGIENAEKRAATFSQRVEKNFIGIFKRDPSQRAENAVSNLIGDITSGNTARGLAQFAGRISGLGIIAGVGIGAAIDIFDKLRDSVIETRKAHEVLRMQMLKPMALVGGLSAEGISQQAGQLDKAIQDLKEKQSTFSHTFTNLLSDVFQRKGGLASTPDFGQAGLDEANELNKAHQRLTETQKERGRVEFELANARKSTSKDETQRALTELYFKSRQAESAIRLEGGKGVEDRLQAVKIEEERLTDEIVHRSEVREQEFKTAEKLLKLQRSNVPDDKKKALAAAISLDAINQQLASPDIGVSEKRSLTLQKLKGENELRDLTQNTRNKFAFGTIAARDAENEQGFGSIAQRNRDTDDASVFGSLGANAMNRGERPQEQSGNILQTIASELQKLTALTTQVWATP